MKNTPDRSLLNRREVLASAGLAAASWLTLNRVLGADNPGANLEDRGSSIRITGLKTYPISGTRVLIKIETNEKVFGWGEISQLVPKAAVALVESMFSLLDGENPTRIEYLWQKLYRAHRDFRSRIANPPGTEPCTTGRSPQLNTRHHAPEYATIDKSNP